MRRVLTPFNVISLLLLVLSGVLYQWVHQPPAAATGARYQSSHESKRVSLTLSFADPKGGFVAEQREVELARETRATLARAALEALVAGPEGEARRVVPEGSEVPDVWVRGEHVFVNLPASYTRLMLDVTEGERLVCGITSTLLHLQGARDVTFLVAGKNTESLLGHVDLREPLRKEHCS